MNLKEETLRTLKDNGYSEEDIDWVGLETKEMWEPHDFLRVADRIGYDSDFDWVEVEPDLKVVMRDGSWFERAEYDGSEWWEHKHVPIKPSLKKHATKERILVDRDY